MPAQHISQLVSEIKTNIHPRRLGEINKALECQQNSKRQRLRVYVLRYTKRVTCKEMDKHGLKQAECNYGEQLKSESVSKKREYVNE